MRTLLWSWLTVFALLLGGCARRGSETERNAEIERRVQERLEVEHEAEREQRLVRRAAALEAGERMLAEQEMLAAREDSYANAADPMTYERVLPPAEGGVDSSADEYSASAGSSYQGYPESYDFAPPLEPAFAEQPYYVVPSPSVVTIFNQSAAIVYLNRQAPGARHHRRHHAEPPRPRQPAIGHHGMRNPNRNGGRPRMGPAPGRSTANRNPTSSRGGNGKTVARPRSPGR